MKKKDDEKKLTKELLNSIKEGSATPKSVKELIRKGADVNRRSRRHIHANKAVNLALKYDRSDLVKVMMKEGGVNVENNETKILLSSIKDGSATRKSIRKLIDDGANVNYCNSSHFGGYGAIHLAIKHNRVDLLGTLVRKGADIGLKTNSSKYEGLTPLCLATDLENSDAVAKLLELGAHVNTQSKILTDVNRNVSDWFSPLQLAAKKGHLKIIDILLNDPKCDINFSGMSGFTPLHHAIMHSPIEVVRRFLYSDKIQVNTMSYHDGFTPLHSAVDRLGKNAPEVVGRLIELGADVNLQTQYYHDERGVVHHEAYTALHLLAKRKAVKTKEELSTNVANLLLDAGADLKLRSKTGKTVLYAATKQGNNPLVHLMLPYADESIVNAPGGFRKQTPLHVASKKHNEDAILALRNAGAETEVKTRLGQTPEKLAEYKRPTKLLDRAIHRAPTNRFNGLISDGGKDVDGKTKRSGAALEALKLSSKKVRSLVTTKSESEESQSWAGSVEESRSSSTLTESSSYSGSTYSAGSFGSRLTRSASSDSLKK